ncbi:hypothetical protein ACJX0J_021047, partial [Zea mays]
AAMNQSSGRYISLRDTLKIMEFLVTLKSEFYLMDVFISVITFCSQLMIKGTNKIMPTLLHVLLVSQVLNALFNLCKINKRRQEQATENGIIPHLMKFVMSDSPLRQKVEQALLKKEAIQNLVKFFQDCPEQFFGHILDAFLKIITLLIGT